MYVGRGSLNLGLTGLDWMLERKIEVEEICDLVWSPELKSTLPAGYWSSRKPPPIQSVKDLRGKKSRRNWFDLRAAT